MPPNPLQRPFILKPPTHRPIEDTSTHAESSLPPEPVSTPNRVINLGTPTLTDTPAVEAAAPQEQHVPDAPASVAEMLSDAAKTLIPESGAYRDSYFSKFMASFANDSANAVDPKILAALNGWLSRVIVTHTTAETALRDFGHAMTEQGVAIDAKLPQLEKLVQELMWIRNMRELMETLTLADYADAIIAREIYNEFGRGAEVEADIAKTKARKFDLENFMVTAMTSIAKNIADLRTSQAAPKAPAASPFRPQQTLRRQPQEPLPPRPQAEARDDA